jgi:hypothetical protein
MATSYGNPPIVTDGLVLCLDAANTLSYPGSGTAWNDLSGQGNSVTLINGPTFNLNNSGSLVFDGVNDYIQTPIQALDRPCTFSTWFYFTSLTTNSGYNTFFGQDTDVSILRGRFYFQKSGGNVDGGQLNKINFSLVKSDGSIVVTNGLNVVQINTWYNYTAVLTTTNISVYENGVIQNSTTNSDFFLSPNTNIILNAAYYNNNIVDFWPGRSSIFHIYNRALSASEVLQNYEATKTRFGL